MIRLTSETALETGDMCFTPQQLENFDHTFLRNLAANANTDEINGKSTKLEIVSYYATQYELTDFDSDGARV